MSDIEFIPLELWEIIFKNWLDIKDLVSLSRVSKKLYNISHQIRSFKKLPPSPFYRKTPLYLFVKDINQVKNWPNITFLKSIYLNHSSKNIEYHPAFHTWKVFPNVLFSINCWIFSKKIPNEYIDRVVNIDSGDPKYLDSKCPYHSFSNLGSSFSEKPSRYTKGVHFRNCDNINLEGYSNLEEIEIIHPTDTDNFYHLEGVKNITIKHNFGNIDVSPFRFCKKLDLTGCMEIEDFTPLKNIKYLTLDQTFIRDISFLEDPIELSLDNCKFIEDIESISGAKNLTKINLNRCFRIKTLESLRGLKKLKWVSVNNCYGIDDVSMLGNIEYLDISRTFVRDVSMLGGLETLHMRSTPVQDVSMLGRLKKLNISCCPKIKDISMLSGIEQLITNIDQP